MSKILGIFTCFNRKEKTESCLNSLIHGNLDTDFFFIAVDDNSTDGTQELLSHYKNIRTISGNGNYYYSGGMRLGIRTAKKCCEKYDWVLFFNDDVVFFPNAVKQLEAYANKKQEIIVGATCDKNGELSYGGVIKTSQFMPSFQVIMSQKERLYCDTFNGNCVLLPVKIFKSLPNIDKHYTHSMGDYDYGLEAQKRNIPITVSNFFVGTCTDNPPDGSWRDTSLSRIERLKRKESPKGLPCQEWFYFINKHYNPLSACINSISPYIKILIGKP